MISIFPSGDQRERVIQYVYERYGKLGAAMTANVITYRGRSAAREVGKALGFDGETLDRLAGLVSSWEYKDPSDTLERQFRDARLRLAASAHAQVLRALRGSAGPAAPSGAALRRHGDLPGQLDSIVPLEPATMPGRVVVQWDKEDCADMGIIKVDLLGLGMMAVLEDSITLIRDHYQEEVDLAKLPPDDPTVYDALQKADTVGMFQIESRAQMSCLPRLQPYALLRHCGTSGDHPSRDPSSGRWSILSLCGARGSRPSSIRIRRWSRCWNARLGVPLFQEQLLRMAMIAAGFTGGEAEELRRAFGFKRSESACATSRSNCAQAWSATASRPRRRSRSSNRLPRSRSMDFPSRTPPALR